MQTYSQIKDPTRSMTDLPGLASRLTLPTGWTYRVDVPGADPVEAARRADRTPSSTILQDSLDDSYSEESGG